MGFLSIFSRKASSSELSGRLIKSQAYDATVASEPPQRGAYPVAGNGPNFLENLSKSANFKSTQFPLHLDIDDTSAPPPFIPRFRGDEIQRPKTAPNSSKSGTSTTKDSSKRQSSFSGHNVSFRKSRINIRPVSALPNGSETPEFSQYGQGFVQVFPPTLPALSTSLPASILPAEAPVRSYRHSHSRNKSMLSDSARSVDILDAQSELSPWSPDFRTRVEAAGLRIYGEDVADRNIALNLDNTHVQAFYAPTDESKKRPPNRDLPLTAVSKEIFQTSISSRSQATSLVKSPFLRPFPDQTPVTKNPTVAKAIKDNNGLLKASTAGMKCQVSLSKGTYVPSGSTSRSSANGPARNRAQSLHRVAQVKNSNSNSLPDRPVTSWDPQSDDAVPQIPHYIPRRQKDESEGIKKSRIPVATPFSQSTHPATKFHSRFQTYQPYQSKSDSRPGTSPNRGSVPSTSTFASTIFDPCPPSLRANSSHVLELPASFAVSGGSDWFAGLDDIKSAPSPCLAGVSTSRMHSEWSETRSPGTRKHSRSQSQSLLRLPPKHGALKDIHEFVPNRTSSRCNCSIASDTVSISSLSSFGLAYGPPSVQTPDTSIDHSFQIMRSVPGIISLPPLRSKDSIYSMNTQEILEIFQETTMKNREVHKDDFNIDGCISSDDDSFLSPQYPRHQDGERLLFKDGGYGISGTQLPGLSLSYATIEPAPAPVILGRVPSAYRSNTCSVRSSNNNSISLTGRSLHSIASLYNAGRVIRKSHSLRRRPTREIEDRLDGNIDGLDGNRGHRRRSRQQSPPYRGHEGSHRLSAVGVKYDDQSSTEYARAARTCVCGAYADKPNPERSNSFAAARRRKQEKIRERTMQLAQRRRNTHGVSRSGGA